MRLCSDLLVKYSSSYSSLNSSSAADGNSSNQPVESAKLRSLIASCLEGVAQATALFSTRYSRHLWHFLKALGMRVICICIDIISILLIMIKITQQLSIRPVCSVFLVFNVSFNHSDLYYEGKTRNNNSASNNNNINNNMSVSVAQNKHFIQT